MGLLDKIFGISGKIRVQFIDHADGRIIGVSQMKADQLPATFSVPTTMHMEDSEWSVEEAIPENAVDFIKAKSLVLKIRKIEKMNPDEIWFTVPTIANELPQTVAATRKTAFDIHIFEDEYRQREFLSFNSLPLMEEECGAIKSIWENDSKISGDYTLFKNCHVRKRIGLPGLTINFSELKAILKCSSTGQVFLNGETIKNGFALTTDNTTYFGILDNGTVRELCISQWNEKTSSEILAINNAYNLRFVNWYDCNIMYND